MNDLTWEVAQIIFNELSQKGKESFILYLRSLQDIEGNSAPLPDDRPEES